GSESVTIRHLEGTAPAADKAWRQLEEASLGERRLSARTEARTRLRVALGLEDPENDGSDGSFASAAPATPTGSALRKRRPATIPRRRPGERRPVRDPAYTSRPGPNTTAE